MRALALPMIVALLLALPLLWRAGKEVMPPPGGELLAADEFRRLSVTPAPAPAETDQAEPLALQPAMATAAGE